MKSLCEDLKNEQEELDYIVKNLPLDIWKKVTPFNNWTIKDEIGHLAYFDDKACLAVNDHKGFHSHLAEMAEGFSDFNQLMEDTLEKPRAMSTYKLLDYWREKREILLNSLQDVTPDKKLPWYGPPMSAESFAIARLMETWAHGQDIADALGIIRKPTERLSHIALLGVKTFGWSFVNRQIEKPKEKVRVELVTPKGNKLTFGDDLKNIVKGDVEDFCLVVTQRRHCKDTNLEVSGKTAEKWMEYAQVFAGPPETGPPQGER